MATWRPARVDDIDHLQHINEIVHHALPERKDVIKERLALFPEGIFVLEQGGEIGGYVASFPIRRHQPPALNTLLGEIPPDADQYYLHDLAILPEFRGHGSARAGIERVLAVAKRYLTTCLVSVYGTASFWGRFGFVPVSIDATLAEKVRGYGEEAVFLSRKN